MAELQLRTDAFDLKAIVIRNCPRRNRLCLTLRWLQSLSVGLILLIAAPLAAKYFNEPRVKYVLWTLAACVAVAGASNIGVVLAQKAFNFSIDFRLQVTGKILGVIATIVAGYQLRDYRALVIGIATSYTSGMLEPSVAPFIAPAGTLADFATSGP